MREGDIDGLRRCTFPYPSHLKMLRFLKKRFKFSKDPVAPEDPTHQNTEIGAERGRDSESEYLSIDLRVDTADGIDSTIAPDLNHGGGSRIAKQDGNVGYQQLPASKTSTPAPGDELGNAGERDQL